MINPYKIGNIVVFRSNYVVTDPLLKDRVTLSKGDFGEIIKVKVVEPSSPVWRTFGVTLFVVMKNGLRVVIKEESVDNGILEILNSDAARALYGEN